VISNDQATLSATIAPEERLSETLDLRDLFLQRPDEE
jgi:hypothetical protein